MPFRSKAQQGYLEANHPEIAKKFAAETPRGSYAKLPAHVKKHVVSAGKPPKKKGK